MATVLRFKRTFKPKGVPEVETNIKIGHETPYI